MRVIVADDSVLFPEGLARILAEIGFEVAGPAANAPSLVELALRTAPDVVVITDLPMPPGFADEGIEAATDIRAAAPHVGLLLSQYVEVHRALRLINDFDGGAGSCSKTECQTSEPSPSMIAAVIQSRSGSMPMT